MEQQVELSTATVSELKFWIKSLSDAILWIWRGNLFCQFLMQESFIQSINLWEAKNRRWKTEMILFSNLEARNKKVIHWIRFCSAAVKSLINYRESLIEESAAEFVKTATIASDLVRNLERITSISDTETNAEIHQRIGQNVFRSVLLEIYNGKCCICGLNVKELLRASHIIP